MPAESQPQPGALLEVDVDRVAHGGHCVGRHQGQVVFVRHTLPGERVRARVTEVGGGGRYLRADAEEVLRSAPGRVERRCPFSGPGRCGGCDWQHVDLARQRELKAAVVTELMARLAGVDVTALPGGPLRVEAVPGDRDGLRWRTRVEFAVDGEGRAGLRKHRSHEVVPVTDCPIADERVVGTGVLQQRHPGLETLDVVAPSAGDPVVVPVPGETAAGHVVTERVPGVGGDREFQVAARGFWQVHPGAAATFVAGALAWLDPQPGERALDLYAGVGVFAAALGQQVGPDGSVVAVEGDRTAVEHARANLADLPWVRVRGNRVDRELRRLRSGGGRHRRAGTDVVVLDPPRTGAGKVVVREVAGLRPRAVAYVACDPAALARDVRYAADQGYRLTRLRALDAFPMTHHVECLALLEPA